ncbi:MAG: cell surface protein, partial [Prochlorococcus marinus CUG1433]|nr:cell surface protein [Prochlorococcus marinus CUG1433]
MKLLGLNSPEIFIILVVLLSILGTKRIEKGFSLIKKLLKFLLSDEENHTLENTKVKVSEPEEIEVKEE